MREDFLVVRLNGFAIFWSVGFRALQGRRQLSSCFVVKQSQVHMLRKVSGLPITNCFFKFDAIRQLMWEASALHNSRSDSLNVASE